MKKLFLLLTSCFFVIISSAQFVAKMEVKEPIPGLCSDKDVYVMLPGFKGQQEAICPVSKEDIQKRLSGEVSFLKDSVSFSGKGMVNIIINCEGKVVQCDMDTKTGNADLDKQIVAVFNSIGDWKPATLKGKKVDSSRLWSFTITNGVITLE